MIEAAPEECVASERSGTLVIEREREGPYLFEEMKEFWTVETLHWAQGRKVGSH